MKLFVIYGMFNVSSRSDLVIRMAVARDGPCLICGARDTLIQDSHPRPTASTSQTSICSGSLENSDKESTTRNRNLTWANRFLLELIESHFISDDLTHSKQTTGYSDGLLHNYTSQRTLLIVLPSQSIHELQLPPHRPRSVPVLWKLLAKRAQLKI
ncbi:hypothetical protein CAEBREN_19223 [Caenorhabditis brenneri]|uniref:Uncharacterized protein n=1 Tax=Caenorhabditis brenneri TaxID=135651 RepID=G0M9P5_CAEBE|nr:hypothetical protein CAEBREN_19223 [Caenorhabditis brenneri]